MPIPTFINMHIKKPGMTRKLIHCDEPSTNSPIFLPFGVIQFGHFFKFAKDKCKDPYPVERYATESKRLLGVLEKRLEGREYLIDDGYSIADMATVPLVYAASNFPESKAKLEIDSLPNVTAWVERCITRPATAKGMTVCKLS
jgi:GST-like protein